MFVIIIPGTASLTINVDRALGRQSCDNTLNTLINNFLFRELIHVYCCIVYFQG